MSRSSQEWEQENLGLKEPGLPVEGEQLGGAMEEMEDGSNLEEDMAAVPLFTPGQLPLPSRREPPINGHGHAPTTLIGGQA